MRKCLIRDEVERVRQRRCSASALHNLLCPSPLCFTLIVIIGAEPIPAAASVAVAAAAAIPLLPLPLSLPPLVRERPIKHKGNRKKRRW